MSRASLDKCRSDPIQAAQTNAIAFVPCDITARKISTPYIFPKSYLQCWVGSHWALPQISSFVYSWKDGQAELAYVAWLNLLKNSIPTDGHPSQY